MPEKFRLRPLHRQRQGRRRTVRVLNQDELCDLFGVDAAGLAPRLDELGWRYHRDGAGKLWATEQQYEAVRREK